MKIYDFFCHSKCLVRGFFEVQTVEYVKNQKILFDFDIWRKITSEKFVAPRV